MSMKKKLYSIICLCSLISIILCACGKKEQGNPIRLPAREDIVSIGVSDGDRYAISPNTEAEASEFIDEFLSMLMDMEITSQQSVNDVPVNKDFITININCIGTAGTTLFYYVDKGIEYIEQPYQGIYKPTSDLGDCITKMLDSADNTPATITFQATVIELSDSSILAEPVSGSLELDSADQFSIPNIDGLELQADDKIEIKYNGEILESYPAQLGKVYSIKIIGKAEGYQTDLSSQEGQWDLIPMVMINGKLYMDTGNEVTEKDRTASIDGKITSEVDGSEQPKEDNQSNFGTGYEYQFSEHEGLIEIHINDKWFVFATREALANDTLVVE